MNTLSRKQREIQEREAKILEVAREMLLRDGYLGLSMDRIAEAPIMGHATVNLGDLHAHCPLQSVLCEIIHHKLPYLPRQRKR